jgi:ABC-type multidrug transport system fused ATPase/permease subunit
VQRADRVIVLHEGRVVESGSPRALLTTASRCRELFAAQLAGLRPAA